MINLFLTSLILSLIIKSQLIKFEDNQIQDLFNDLDTNDNNFISFNEFEILLKNLGFVLSPKKRLDLFKTYDLNIDYKISEKEFKKSMNNYFKEKKKKNENINRKTKFINDNKKKNDNNLSKNNDLMEKFFYMFDSDKNNYIDFEEMKKKFYDFGDLLDNKNVENYIKAFDSNNDNIINFEEFKKMNN